MAYWGDVVGGSLEIWSGCERRVAHWGVAVDHRVGMAAFWSCGGSFWKCDY